MKNLELLGVGHAHPTNLVTNDDLSKFIDTNDTWIQERTGIKSRYISHLEKTSDLATQAAHKAIQDAKLDPLQIDCIIVATFTPDAQMPSTAAMVQRNLGLNNQRIMAFDLNGACTGFILALQTATALLEAKQASTVLLIGAETISKILDFTDRSTCVLFGDGAGAVVLRRSKSQKRWIHYINSQGDTEESLVCDPIPLNASLQNQSPVLGYLRMKGQAVYRFAVFAVEDAIRNVLQNACVDLKEIDWIIPHQANLRILMHVAQKMDIDMGKFITNLQTYGNTSSASIPIALSEAKIKGLIHENQKVILIGFGAGLAWGATYIEL